MSLVEDFKENWYLLKRDKSIAIDVLLTQGRGKRKMRIYEKFLSQKIFRVIKVSSIPPAPMPNFVNLPRN